MDEVVNLTAALKATLAVLAIAGLAAIRVVLDPAVALLVVGVLWRLLYQWFQED